MLDQLCMCRSFRLLTQFFFFSSRRRHTRCSRDWSSDVCSSDLMIRDVAVTGVQTCALPILGRAYLGLGPAAHSFDGRVRRWNVAAWEAYRRAVVAGLPAVEAEEVLTEEQRELERLYLGEDLQIGRAHV